MRIAVFGTGGVEESQGQILNINYSTCDLFGTEYPSRTSPGR